MLGYNSQKYSVYNLQAVATLNSLEGLVLWKIRKQSEGGNLKRVTSEAQEECVPRRGVMSYFWKFFGL